MSLRLAWQTELRSVVRRTGLTPLLQRARAALGGDDGAYEGAFGAALRAAIREGDTVWDVGANVGLYTRLFSDWVTATGEVVAIEPAPASFRALRCELDDRTNVRLFELALGERSSTMSLRLDADPESPTHSLVSTGHSSSTILVEVLAGDALRSRERLAIPHVIKVDVEGFELEALRGLDLTLKNQACRAVLCEVHFGLLAARGHKQAPRAIDRYLRARGFRVEWIDASHIGAYRT